MVTKDRGCTVYNQASQLRVVPEYNQAPLCRDGTVYSQISLPNLGSSFLFVPSYNLVHPVCPSLALVHLQCVPPEPWFTLCVPP